MTELFFYSAGITTTVFFIMICLFATQATYVGLMALNYRMREIRFLIGEMLLLVYISVMTVIPVTVLIYRRYSVISLSHLEMLLYVVGIPGVIYFIYLSIKKTQGSPLAALGIILTLPVISNFMYGGYIIFFSLAIVILSFRMLTLTKSTLHRQKNELNAFSIMDGLDKLPCGVMFYDLSGYIFLTNAKMTDLAMRFVKKEPKNGNHFWNVLERCNISDVESQIVEGDILLRTPNAAWRFSKQQFRLGNFYYNEITAIDVTESIGAFYTLEEENEKLERQNEETKKLAKSIETLHREREYARIRSRVHDVLGQRLTAIQRISQTDQDVDYNTLLFLSKDAIEQIKTKRGGNARELFGEIYNYFYKIGLSIELNNDLPEEEHVAFLFLSVLREACTNAIKHAQATKMFVQIEQGQDMYRIEITNNGNAPQRGLIEGGGLFGIRNRVESLGGTLKVEVIPEFSLIITIKRGLPQ